MHEKLIHVDFWMRMFKGSGLGGHLRCWKTARKLVWMEQSERETSGIRDQRQNCGQIMCVLSGYGRDFTVRKKPWECSEQSSYYRESQVNKWSDLPRRGRVGRQYFFAK